jgi:hypothetical protein
MAGLQIFDASGNLILDSDVSICRVMGYISITGNGSVSVPNGRPWFAVLNENSFNWEEMSYDFNVSGTTLSWTAFPANPLSPPPPTMNIVYGAY